jgi:hypothetical protein
MSPLRTLKQLVLGETWLLPAGVAVVVSGSGLLVRPLLGDEWDHVGGLILLGGILALLVLSIARDGRAR